MRFQKQELINFDPNLENPQLLQINRLAPRATVIPSLQRGVYYRNKEESSLLLSLNGDYRFFYRPCDDMPNFYYRQFDDNEWDVIDVPSMWQYRGYGKPSYPNVRYNVPFTPPYIKRPNPVGYYRRSFEIQAPAARTVLHFGGVDNAFYVYLNGEFVGFSKGSRLPSEFDVTNLIRSGRNLLAVKVFTYSDATFLENQDMLLANGIFRDVYLLQTGETTLWDYRITTTYQSVTVQANLLGDVSGYDVTLTLGGATVTLPAAETVSHTFVLENARLWTAETPNLYDLYIELFKGHVCTEVHSKRVGIMHTRVQGNKFLVNEQPIYIKGINRHENNAKNGRAVTVQQIEQDLRLIKSNNLNAVRLSHYTQNPATYEIAAEIGLYLMDEADLETHGAEITGDLGALSMDPLWFEAYRDRVVRMLETNKNETAIFIRSTGNECGRGENLDKCLDIIREFDPTKECLIAQGSEHRDIHFRLIAYYPMSRAMEQTDEGYPVLAFEYGHAMGNSPGTLKDYWDYNYTHEKMLGGFAWEFRSHGFYAEDAEGTLFYQFGGDFDDLYHWSNFSIDGFCMSDGTPKPSWYELGEVSFAAYAFLQDGNLMIKNTNDFRDLSYLTAAYEICEDYRVIRSAPIHIPAVLPHDSFAVQEADLTVRSPKPGAAYYLNVYFYENGKQVSKKQFVLPNSVQPKPFVRTVFDAGVSVNDYILSVFGKDFRVEFTQGMLSRYQKKGKELINAPMRLNLFRAPTDNDGIVNFVFERHAQEWERFFLKDLKFDLYDISVEEQSECISVHTVGKLCADTMVSGFDCVIRYDILADGMIHVSVVGTPFGKQPAVLPRIGLIIPMQKEFSQAEWYGRGPRENYPDCKSVATVGLYQEEVTRMNTFYDHPQENGNHENNRFLRLLSVDGRGLSVSAQGEFSFSYHDFSLEDLTRALHKNELKRSKDFNYLYLDYKMRGLGSNSCGPQPEEQYELRAHSFVFSFVLSDVDRDRALELARTDFGVGTAAVTEDYQSPEYQRIVEIADCMTD